MEREKARPAKRARRPRAYHHGDLRSALIRRGRELLERHGAAGLSLRAAARLAGVSQAAPAHHFRNKEGLLAAIAAEGFAELAEARVLAIRTRAAPLEVLRRVMLAHADFATRHPHLFHLMFGNELLRRGRYPELNEAATTSFELLRHVVREWLAGTPGPKQAEGPVTLAVWMMMHGQASALADRQSFPASVGAVSTPRLVDVLIGLLAARTGILTA
jgi:AcrR family transcriptional regulator